MKSVSKPIEQIETIDEVIQKMIHRLHHLEKKEDYRAIFQRVYLLMTQEMQQRLESGFFEDPIWMERVLVRFAHYYFKASNAYEAGEPCPQVWSIAFQLAARKNSFVLQDALLGINAHINRDLPLVLHKVLLEDQIWPDAHLMLHRRRDHERINDVLADLVDLVQDELTHHYARLFKIIDFFMARKDESFSAYFLSNCRTNVWYNTEILLDADDEEEFMYHKERIDQEACAVAKHIADSQTFRLINRFAPLTRQLGWF